MRRSYIGRIETLRGHPDALSFLGILTYHKKDYKQALGYVVAPQRPPRARCRTTRTILEICSTDRGGRRRRRHRGLNESMQWTPPKPEPCRTISAPSTKRALSTTMPRDCCAKRCSLNPKHGPAHHNLGEVLVRTVRPKLSIDHFWQAVAYMPSHQFNPYFIAMAYDRIGKRDEAISCLDGMAAEGPGNVRSSTSFPVSRGRKSPDRASDQFVEDAVFDRFASSFEARLKRLDYQPLGP